MEWSRSWLRHLPGACQAPETESWRLGGEASSLWVPVPAGASWPWPCLATNSLEPQNLLALEGLPALYAAALEVDDHEPFRLSEGGPEKPIRSCPPRSEREAAGCRREGRLPGAVSAAGSRSRQGRGATSKIKIIRFCSNPGCTEHLVIVGFWNTDLKHETSRCQRAPKTVKPSGGAPATTAKRPPRSFENLTAPKIVARSWKGSSFGIL